MEDKTIEGKIKGVGEYSGPHDGVNNWTLIMVQPTEGGPITLSLRENRDNLPEVTEGANIKAYYKSKLPLFGALSGFHEITSYKLED